MSELRVNKIIPKDGLAASGTSTGAGGGIIQVVSFTYRGQSSGNNGSSYVSTGIKATITPQSSSNKILVQASVMYDVTVGVWAGIRLYRGGNCVTGAIPTGTFYTGYSVIDGKSINANWIALSYQANMQNHNEQYFEHAYGQYMDSPGTTSSIEYDLRAIVRPAGSPYWYINQCAGGVNADHESGGTSSITLMEISA